MRQIPVNPLAHEEVANSEVRPFRPHEQGANRSHFVWSSGTFPIHEGVTFRLTPRCSTALTIPTSLSPATFRQAFLGSPR
jgi:hypothetical protein